jgi:hypothetical protein
MDLKAEIIKKLEDKGVNVANLRIKFYKESPYQKRRFKPEFVDSECWIHVKGRKEGYVITKEDFTKDPDLYIDMIAAEVKN